MNHLQRTKNINSKSIKQINEDFHSKSQYFYFFIEILNLPFMSSSSNLIDPTGVLSISWPSNSLKLLMYSIAPLSVSTLLDLLFKAGTCIFSFPKPSLTGVDDSRGLNSF